MVNIEDEKDEQLTTVVDSGEKRLENVVDDHYTTTVGCHQYPAMKIA